MTHGHGDAGRFDGGDGGVEALELARREGVVGLVGDRAVGPHGLQGERRFRVDQLGQRHEVTGGGADAVHPRVDLQVDGDDPTTGLRQPPRAER